MHKNQGIILPIILFIVIALVAIYYGLNLPKTEKFPQPKDQDVALNTITPLPTHFLEDDIETPLIGMIWTSGLFDDEKVVLKIDPDYQLEKSSASSSGWPGEMGGLFLLSNGNNLSKYLGKCASLSGEIVKGWENIAENDFEINGKWTYNRSAVNVDNIEVVDLNKCITEFNRTVKNQETEYLIYKRATGTLNFAERPAPDISYDIRLDFDEPVLDKNNATGRPAYINWLDISASTDEIYKLMLNNIGKKAEVEGYMNWGYAESQYLLVEQINIL